MRILVSCVLVAVAVSACSGKSREPTSAETSQAPAVQSASEVVDAFEKGGLKVVDVRVVTEADDDNHLLGRPGQYSSKVFFYDARHPRSTEGGDEGENTVEYFASAADAKTRHDYIDSVTKGVPMLMQYQILQGNVLARFDKVMLPSEVDAYKKVIAQLKAE